MNTQANPIVDAYIRGVLNGAVVAGQWLTKAVNRHLDDLAHGHERGLYFDEAAGQRVVDFIEEFCVPSDRPTNTKLLPWQQFWISLLFSWKKQSDGTRRWKRALLETGKKSGKSFLTSALLIYALVADGEEGGRMWCAANTMKQARQVFGEACSLRNRNTELRGLIQQSGREPPLALYVPGTGCRLAPLSRDTGTTEGLVSSFAILDELHLAKDTRLWTILKYGSKTRRQPLLIGITTAGSSAGGTTPAWAEHEFATRLLDGLVQDDEFFPLIYAIDETDDYKLPQNWRKANPSCGPVSEGYLFDVDVLQKEFDETESKPSARGDFIRFSCNRWSNESEDPAIELAKWDACSIVPLSKHPDPVKLRAEAIERLKGRLCFGGVDLAPKLDLSSLVLLFPPRDSTERWEILEYFWIPADNIEPRVKRDRVDYDLWRDHGFLVTTPGNLTDVRYISEQIVELSNYFDLKEIAYDSAWSGELIRLLGEANFPMSKFVDHPQTHQKMNVPCQEFMRKVLRKEFIHSANPCMRWQINNLRWNTQKGTGFIRPDRGSKRQKIDGPASLMMALSRAISPDNRPKPTFWVVTSA
jgi:phage terminase large subunit-like protein